MNRQVSDHSEKDVLCGKCGALHGMHDEYCSGCGAPVGLAATLDPMKSIAAAGGAYRGASLLRRHAGLVCFGCWLLFFPQVLLILISLMGEICIHLDLPEVRDFYLPGCQFGENFAEGRLRAGEIGLLLGLMALYGAILFRVTGRYLDRLEG